MPATTAQTDVAVLLLMLGLAALVALPMHLGRVALDLWLRDRRVRP